VTINDTLTFTIVGTNIGNVTLNNVVISDNMITPNSTSCATLSVGATCVLVGTYVVQQSDVDNGQIVNVAQAISDETINDPETDTETVDTEGPVTAPVRVPTLSTWMMLLMAILMIAVVGRRQYRFNR